MWDRIKKLLQGDEAPTTRTALEGTGRAPYAERATETRGFEASRPDLANVQPAWVEAGDNPFGVRVLDVRPVTLGTLSMSRDPQMAANAVSYGGEDGTSFAAGPRSQRRLDTTLSFRAPEHLLDGALFIPNEMEDKWAVFIQAQALVLVRSWRREVFLRAPARVEGDSLVIGPIHGFVTAEDEPVEYTRRAVDFIVRTHALRAPWPAPLLGNDGVPAHDLALEAMSSFGRQAHWGSFVEPARAAPPQRRLRVMHRLHVAVMRGDLDAVREALSHGAPVALRDCFGRCPIHYAKEVGLLAFLRAEGAELDERTDDEETLLMFATQERAGALVRALLDAGANARAADRRGFSALHRAAEMGEVEIARLLLVHGANADLVAEGGHSPRSLATGRGTSAILALFVA